MNNTFRLFLSDAEVFISQRKHNLSDLESIQKITDNSPGGGATASSYLIKVVTMESFVRSVGFSNPGKNNIH